MLRVWHLSTLCLFFFNDTATTEIYTLSLHDALPISTVKNVAKVRNAELVNQLTSRGLFNFSYTQSQDASLFLDCVRSEEHTSELQSRQYLVCRLLLEKKKKKHLTLVFGQLYKTHPLT